jgi:osmotically-inducible protein OsmY
VQVNFERDGKVVLEGTVASKDDRKRAKDLVSGIPGVKKVKEKLKVDESLTTAAAAPVSAAAGVAAGTTGGVSGTTAQQPPQAQASGSAATSGSIAGSTQAGAAGASGSMTAGAAPADLQSRIQQALQRENLSNINVVVSATTIDLSGTVSTGKEKQTAKRIAQSFAGNMKVVDRITVSGMGQGANQGQSAPTGSQPVQPSTVPQQDKPR